MLESFVAQWMLGAIGYKFDVKQFGGLRGRSTIHALIDILHLWYQALDKTHSVRVLFINFTETFDHVDHVIVLEKLAGLGVPECICRWFHSFLCDRQQAVKLAETQRPHATRLTAWLIYFSYIDQTIRTRMHSAMASRINFYSYIAISLILISDIANYN